MVNLQLGGLAEEANSFAPQKPNTLKNFTQSLGLGHILWHYVYKSRRMRLGGHVAWMGEIRNSYKILVSKP
jgi:hypothetical protein